MAKQTDLDLKVFVERLINDESDAWLLLKERVEKYLKEDKQFNEILNRTSHPYDEFVNTLIVHLKEDNMRRLKGCKEPEAFWQWLNRVEHTVLNKLRDSKEVLIRIDKIPGEQSGNRDQIGDSPGAVEEAKRIFNRQIHQRDASERLKITRESFVKLWKEDPQSTFIMFARFELDVPSRDVGTLLGIKSNYVDVMVNRMRAKLRDEESKML